MKSFLKYCCLVFVLMLSFICTKDYTSFAAPIINRVWGSNRYATSVQISRYGWNESAYAVLVSGKSYPDALCATPLAKKYNAPLLLVSDDNLSEVSGELGRLKVQNVIIVGGTNSVSQKIEDTLKLNYKCSRIAGVDRYDTSVKVAREIPDGGQIFICSGLNFPDGLSAAPVAADKGIPILLVGSEMNIYLKDYLTAAVPDTAYIVGGTSAVNGYLKDSINKFSPSVIRIGGSNRYDTNYDLLQYFHYDSRLSDSYIASGDNFPDALSASALCALNSSPIILVSNALTYSTNQFITKNENSIDKLVIIGGTNAIYHRTVNVLLNLSSDLIDNISTIKGSQQVIIVSAPDYGTDQVKVTAYDFSPDSEKWNVFLQQFSGVIGMNGFSANRHEGDKTTPVGTYGFPFLFGWYGNAGFKMPYRLAGPGDYWVSNNTLDEYNVWMHYTGDPSKRFTDYETLATEPLYKYAAVIDFNYGPGKVLGKGSGIFLHIAPPSGGGTLGCVGIPEDKLLQILKWMDPAKDPVIIMGPQTVLNNM